MGGVTSIFVLGEVIHQQGSRNEARDVKGLAHVEEIGCFVDLKI